MATIGLRGATIAKYHNNNGVVTYDTPISGGCSRRAELQLQFAEAELWGCDGLRESIREAVGGNITFEATFFSNDMQVLAFGATIKQREVTYTIVSENEANLREGKLAIGTPIAKALLGKKKGDVVEVTVPAGIIKFEILDISI